MKCFKCGADLSDNSKFCSFCGAKIESKVSDSSQTADDSIANGVLTEAPDEESYQSASAQQNTSGGKRKSKLQSFWSGLDLFSKVSVVSIVIIAILLIIAISTGKALPIFLSALQFSGVIVALLMHKEKIKLAQKKKWAKYLVLALAILFTALNVMSYSLGRDNKPANSPANNPTDSQTPSATNTPAVITTASAPYGSSDCIGKPYAGINSDFSSAGFVSVEVEKVEDLQSTEADRVDTIESISIGGKPDFTAGQEFDKYDDVIIRYHAFEPYHVTIHVDFISNLIFSKYDVDLLVNSETKGTLTHGVDQDFELDLEPGANTLTFKNTESSSVKGEVSLMVDRDMEISYQISCHSDKVTVEDITAELLAEQQAQAAEEERIAAEAAAAEKAAAMMNALEQVLPQEMAKRAAVVAITNYCVAIDVFMPDGNTLDETKFHSYADTSGNFFDYYIGVKDWGEWTAKDEETWHVEQLRYENCFGNEQRADLDVRYDGENYHVSNVVTAFGDLSDPNKSGTTEYSEEFVVAPELIQEDRAQTRLDSYDSWVDDQFSGWDGSHKELTALIKENLNDEKSYDHIETTYHIIYSEAQKTELNDALKSVNNSARVEIGDLFIATEFSAKNAFNATVTNTAYAVVSFVNNSISLIAIG